MFRFTKKMFVTIISLFNCNALNATPVKCILINNQECRIRPEILNINSNEPTFYPYSEVIVAVNY